MRDNTLLHANPSDAAAATRDILFVSHGVGEENALMRDIDSNNATVTAFYALVFNHRKPAEAIQQDAGDVYLQHNPA